MMELSLTIRKWEVAFMPTSFFDMLPSLLWYTESDKMIGDQDEKDSFSIFRLPVRFSRGWKPSVWYLPSSGSFLQFDGFDPMGFLFMSPFDLLVRNQDWTTRTGPSIWDGDLPHGWDDFIDLSLTTLSDIWRTRPGSLVDCFPLRLWLDLLLYQDPYIGKTESQCHP